MEKAKVRLQRGQKILLIFVAAFLLAAVIFATVLGKKIEYAGEVI